MTRVIKFADAAAVKLVRPFGTATASSAPPEAAIDPELAALRREAERDAAQLAERDLAIADLQASLEQACRDAEAKGRLAAVGEARKLHAESLAALQQSMSAALGGLRDSLSSLDRLAIMMARECLGAMIADPESRIELLSRMIRLQLERVETQALVRIDVSREDFGDGAELANLVATLGDPALDLRASDDLGAGDCTIKLQLGAIEVGIGQQWGKLAAALDAMAQPRIAA